MRNLKIVFLGIATGFLAHAAVIVSAPQDANIFPWGITDTSTYGQTVTAPSNSVLQSFTFYLGPQYAGSGNINYQADVYAWDPVTDEATGPALYTSATMTYTPGAVYTPITISPGIDVTGGDQYILFFTTAGLQGGQPSSQISWGLDANDDYTGGGFFFQNSGNAVEFTSPWDPTLSFDDLAFSADFAPASAPEPSSIVLLATLIGVFLVVSRSFARRRA